MPATISPQEALIYAMVTMSAVDRSISTEELSRIGSVVRQLPMFDGFQEEQLVGIAKDCGEALASTDGLNKTLEMIDDGLPARLRETAYMLALEVAAVDLKIEAEEIRFLELLADKLRLDRLTTAALERGARARHQRV
ncbi:MAG: tellurite resistance TerB family protein [Pseudomonadota bacterium]